MTSPSHRVGYNGVLHERGAGWQLLGNGYRIYSPALMRFHSPDSLSPFGEGGINAYAYGVGDPINHEDPSGHAVVPVLAALFAVGAASVGAAAVISKASGNHLRAEILGAVAGLLAAGAGTVALRALVSRATGTRQGQMRVLRGADRDVVIAHGAPNATAVGKVDLDGSELAAVLRSKGVGEKPITLISCHGADGPASQGQVLANATRQVVTTYQGPVVYNPLFRTVLWGSRVKLRPETGIQRAATAIRNQALNRRAQRSAGRPIPQLR